MKQYEILDTPGDAGIRVYGKNIFDIFVNSAIGMYSLITDPAQVKEAKSIEVSVESHTLEGLFVSWLNELIFHFDAYGFIGKTVNIHKLSNVKITASICGEDFDPERHKGKLLIKAATYHKLRIEKTGDSWQADVIFDI